jgi:flagellar operon protein
MEVKKISQFENVATPEARKPSLPNAGGTSFAETLGRLQQPGALGENPAALGVGLTNAAPAAEPVKFSNHAVERMMSRGIQFNKEDMNRLNEAVQRAASKGSKDSLILMNDSALIVSVKNKTVVTVMDKNALKENVFTNIDSTIVM